MSLCTRLGWRPAPRASLDVDDAVGYRGAFARPRSPAPSAARRIASSNILGGCVSGGRDGPLSGSRTATRARVAQRVPTSKAPVPGRVSRCRSDGLVPVGCEPLPLSVPHPAYCSVSFVCRRGAPASRNSWTWQARRTACSSTRRCSSRSSSSTSRRRGACRSSTHWRAAGSFATRCNAPPLPCEATLARARAPLVPPISRSGAPLLRADGAAMGGPRLAVPVAAHHPTLGHRAAGHHGRHLLHEHLRGRGASSEHRALAAAAVAPER
jgi:hypothetical protein